MFRSERTRPAHTRSSGFGGNGKRLVIENGAEAEVSAGLAAMIGEAEPRAGLRGTRAITAFVVVLVCEHRRKPLIL
jgi:hypothetical protein